MDAEHHPSSADPADVELYMQGSCHAFALALHRTHGMRLLVATDLDERYWEDEADADNYIPSVVHVMAVDGEGVAWDVTGSRPVASVPSYLAERHPDVRSLDVEEACGEFGLSTYVDGMGGDDADRPLHSLSETDLEEARDCADRVLSGVPGYPVGCLAPGVS